MKARRSPRSWVGSRCCCCPLRPAAQNVSPSTAATPGGQLRPADRQHHWHCQPGGQLHRAASIDWALDAARNVQLYASGQRTTLQLPARAVERGRLGDLYYLHLGGSNFFEGRAGKAAAAGGLGRR